MIATGYKTRLHYSQDIDTKKASKPRQGNNIIHRETVGMERFPCHGRLNVTLRSATALNPSLKIVIIRIEHHAAHVLYYDVSMKSEALHILRDNLQWSTPSSLVPIIQESHPEVTAAQIHSAWTRMSEEIWKKDQAQLLSAKILLDSAFGDEVDVLEAITEDGVDMLAWGMKKVIQKLDIVQNGIEIALDATYETNSRHLELYALMCEYDNAGFPLSYCLLSTVDASGPGKRIKAISKWITRLRDKQGHGRNRIHYRSLAHGTNSNLLVAWRKAIGEWISKTKLSTTPYNASRAHSEFDFIDPTFIPPGQPDPGESEGGREGGGWDNTIDKTPLTEPSKLDPNAIYITIPPTQSCSPASLTPPLETTSRPGFIKIPAMKVATNVSTEPEADGNRKRTFCPLELRKLVLDKVEVHRLAHPSIPGYAAPSAKAIYYWAVKQMYTFCQDYDLRELWAYLWENWYRPAQWKLWARSVVPEITVLKTTMICESQ
ncbi:hypothetical protein F5890DRAFT_1655723 [Lentinula detonsa]|uniref:Uncharacterized protein n=1 Tax=Lentinula detonsa TaxID=2804962 RepID=A0AA38PN25_9AGAR|nr:hypothetical protein F5890DRAFT_1655723 [Lentinula detonsa]